ncbi:exotoxin beta-grasp domain-containing protein [Staphylococcus xylosus]
MVRLKIMKLVVAVCSLIFSLIILKDEAQACTNVTYNYSNDLKSFYSKDPSYFTNKQIKDKYANKLIIDVGIFPGSDMKWEVAAIIEDKALYDSLKVGDYVDIRGIRNERVIVCNTVKDEVYGGITKASEPLLEEFGKPSAVFGTDQGSHTLIAGQIVVFNREIVTMQEVDYKLRKRLIEKEGLYSNELLSKGKVYAHMYNGDEIFISDLSQKSDYRNNNLINVENVSHFDIDFKR